MAGPPPYREPIGALKDPMHPPPFGLGQVSFQVMGGEGWQGQRNCETPPGQERSETPLLVLFSLNEYKFLSTQRSFSQPFASLINNNSGGGQSRSAAAVPPAYSAQCKGDSWDSLEGGSPQASGQPLGLAVNCVSRKMLQWGSCRKPCSPLPSRLCGCFSQPLPPPQLLGKFSIKLLGGGVVRAAAGEEWWWKEEGARGLQRRANWGTAAGRRACTHAHTHARMHARPPGAAAMQGPSRTGWPRCARRPPGLRQGTARWKGRAFPRRWGRTVMCRESCALACRRPTRPGAVVSLHPSPCCQSCESSLPPPPIPEEKKCFGKRISAFI